MAELSHIDLDDEVMEVVDEKARESINEVKNDVQIQFNEVNKEIAVGELKTAHGTSVHIDNSKDAPCIVNVYGKTEQFSTTGKNLLDCSGLSEKTTSGITFTPVYEDGMLQYINVNGTATARAYYSLLNKTNVPTESRILNGCKGGSKTTYGLIMTYREEDDTYVKDGYQTGADTTIDTTQKQYNIAIYVESGITVNNVKFYPMVRLSTITDGTYEPYTNGASPNPDYPQKIESTVISEIRTCSKNLLKTYETTTVNGVTFTVNSDGSVTANGTATANAHITSVLDLEAGDYIMSGCPSGGSTTTYFLYAIVPPDFATSHTSYGAEKKITLTEKTTMYFRPRVQAGYTANNLTFYPMVRLASDTDETYEPYTETVATLPDPITLNGLDDVKDYVDTKNLAQVEDYYTKVFDGTETITRSTVSTGGGGYFLYADENIKYAVSSTQVTGSFCNYLEEKTSNYLWANNEVGFSIDSKGAQFRFRLSETITTVDQAQAWLAEKYAEGNPFTIVVPRAETLITPLSEANVEALRALKSFNGITNAYNNASAEMDFTYASTDNAAVNMENNKEVSEHTSNKSNPHGVTKTQVGLGNVDNTADADKSVKFATSATKATQDDLGNEISTYYVPKSDLPNTVVSVTTTIDVTSIASGRTGDYTAMLSGLIPEGYKLLCMTDCHTESSDGSFNKQVDVFARVGYVNEELNVINLEYCLNNSTSMPINCKIAATFLFIKK